MQGVILAAGDGGRLAPLTLDTPKPLVTVLGKPMIDYTIEALVTAGVKELLVVVGYKAELMEKHLKDGTRYGACIRLIYNPDFEMGNAISLYAARDYLPDGPFILAMADHLVSPSLIQNLLQGGDRAANNLAVDYKPIPLLVDEATKVLVDEQGCIRQIGKKLRRWNGVDTGVFLLTPEVFEAISRNLQDKGDCELSDAMTWLIEEGSGLKACDVTGSFWLDVDNLQDLRLAERLLRKEGRDGKGLIRRHSLSDVEQKDVPAYGPHPRPYPRHPQSGLLSQYGYRIDGGPGLRYGA
ncbi:MAG TPA: phosphocholine cytidylyltransferase family protein [Chloroflexi bacterium]|nr:phosphocholine cytidylyltransferase family protein [Chloroflexota bacterium]